MTAPLHISSSKAQQFLNGLIPSTSDGHRATDITEIVEHVKAAGVTPGDSVLVIMPNGIAFAELVFALLIVGAVPVMLPSSAPALRAIRIGEVIGARFVAAPNIADALLAVGTIARDILPDCQVGMLRNSKIQNYKAGQVVLLTSGTSGIFSGCLFGLEALLRNAERHASAISQRPADILLINLPTYYSYAFVAQLLATYVVGNRAVISGPPFTPTNYERVLQEHDVTVSSLTPLMVDGWLQSGARALPPTLRCLTVGGAALKADSVSEILRRNPSLELYVTYGLTECGPRVSTLAAHLEPATRYASVGLPLPGVEVALRATDPQHNDHGELIVETDTGMIRRIGRTDADPTPLSDGRVRIETRDVFYRDQEGYLFFRDRCSSSALIHGQKISVRSVCQIAETIDGVTKAEAWVSKDADGSENFTLDIYCRDDTLSIPDIRRQLGRVLLRSEQPNTIVLHPGADPGWRKTELSVPGRESITLSDVATSPKAENSK